MELCSFQGPHYAEQTDDASKKPDCELPFKTRSSPSHTEMLRAGVSFPVLMKLLGHTSPDMTMRYLDVALTDLQREFQRARSQPRHLVPQPKLPSYRLRAGLDGVIDSLLAAQHVLEMMTRSTPAESYLKDRQPKTLIVWGAK